MRVRLARLRNEDEDSTNKLYTLVTHVTVAKVQLEKDARVRKVVLESVTFWCGSGSQDPYFRLMDPDPTSLLKFYFASIISVRSTPL